MGRSRHVSGTEGPRPPAIGKLSTRVTIQAKIRGTPDAFGQVREDWRDVTHAWAEITPIASSELALQFQNLATIRYQVRMYYLALLRASMRLVFTDAAGTHHLDIDGIEDIDGAGAFMLVRCKERGG